MLTDKSKKWDRLFVALLVIAVTGTWVGMHLYANHLKAEKAEQAAAAKEPRRVLRLEAITHVFECERDGKRILSDRPCGTGVQIRVKETRDSLME
jgi:flagellar basal body-associated protein FliL